jgi:hypothetical protein
MSSSQLRMLQERQYHKGVTGTGEADFLIVARPSVFVFGKDNKIGSIVYLKMGNGVFGARIFDWEYECHFQVG